MEIYREKNTAICLTATIFASLVQSPFQPLFAVLYICLPIAKIKKGNLFVLFCCVPSVFGALTL
jgi:hypothetical protein